MEETVSKTLGELAKDLSDLGYKYYKRRNGPRGFLASGWPRKSQMDNEEEAYRNYEKVKEEVEREKLVDISSWGYSADIRAFKRLTRFLEASSSYFKASSGFVYLNEDVDNNTLYREIQRLCIKRIKKAHEEAINKEEKKIIKAVRPFYTGRGAYNNFRDILSITSDILHFRIGKDYLTLHSKDGEYYHAFTYSPNLTDIIRRMSEGWSFSCVINELGDCSFYKHARRPIKKLLKSYEGVNEQLAKKEPFYHKDNSETPIRRLDERLQRYYKD